MALFHKESHMEETGIIVDIGSGSVGIAIVWQNNDQTEVLWSHREQMLIKELSTPQAFLKEMHTTLVNGFLELGSSGLKTIATHTPKITPRQLQITFSAPWAHTITKHITFEDETSFVVTKDVIESLVSTAQKEAKAEEETQKSDFTQITEATIHVALNGYLTKQPLGQRCTSVHLAQIMVTAQNALLETLGELQNKIIPKTKATQYSFMYVLYQTLRHLYPDTSEICLVDITNEATEIGIVRDDVLTHSAYIPHGLYSLARQMANACEIPKEEAYTFLKNGSDALVSLYGEKNAAKVESIFAEYQDALARLFKETGDALSIPKTIFLHTSQHTENFFSKHLKEAAKKTTKSTHSVHLVTTELLNQGKMGDLSDTALAVSIHFFAHKTNYMGFEHEITTHNL